MTVFVDTSALYAVLDRDDENHQVASKTWAELLRERTHMVTHNYVLLETSALLQHRLGLAALREFHESVAPVLEVEWISEFRHRAGTEAALAAARKKLSIVDCISFQTMRERGIRIAFCFDSQFREQGFTSEP
jgi:predicted nucleic acid-binding protein